MRKLKYALAVLLSGVGLWQGPVQAQPYEHHRDIAVHHERPRGYRPIHLERHRFYRGFPIVRLWGPVYPGFGFFYDDAAAWAFLGFTAWELAAYNQMTEDQLRAHEQAIVEAANAPVNEPIAWNDGPASGTVTTVREGHTADGRACREFQQMVTIDGKSERAYGTACQEPDGSWKMVNNQP
jgi:hypothetical protein